MARDVTQGHGKTLSNAEGEITRGLEVVEFATGIPQLLKGEHSETLGRASMLIDPPGGRVCPTGHDAVQLPRDGADVDVPRRAGVRKMFVLMPSERDPTTRWPRSCEGGGLPEACSIVHGDREPVDVLLSIRRCA